MYGRMLGQWALEMNHVAAIVGGFSSQQKHAGQQGVIFQPIPREKQAGAVRFLSDNAFQTPTWAIDPEILRRIEPVGVLDRVRAGQLRVMTSLLSSPRIMRLVEQEALDGAAAYRALDFLADVRKGVWTEIYGTAPVRMDPYRRNLQRAYVDTLADRVNGRLAAVDDTRAFFRGELKTLDADLRTAAARTTDRASRLHIEDVRNQIARALDHTVYEPAAAAGGRGGAALADRGEGAGTFDVSVDPESCWVDYPIRGRK
jgi:hypothetical protein